MNNSHWFNISWILKSCPYDTTIFIILLLLAVYIIECKARVPVDEIDVSRDILWNRKRFHRFFLALVSHPPSNTDSISSQDSSSSSQQDSTNNADDSPPNHSSSREIPLGSDSNSNNHSHHRHDNSNNRTTIRSRIQFHRLPVPDILLRWRATLRFHTLSRRVQPFVSSSFISGLPLLLYIIHLLWQCRHLEPLMDLAYERINWLAQIQQVGHSTPMTQALFHSLTIVLQPPSTNQLQLVFEQNPALHDFLLGKFTYRDILLNTTKDMVSSTDNTTISSVLSSLIQHLYQVSDWTAFLNNGPYSYLRIILVLSLISYLIPILFYELFIQSSPQSTSIPTTLSRLSSSSTTTSTTSSSDPTYCTLSSTIISLLYLHTYYFPLATFYIFPFISTSNSLLKLFIPTWILVLLYRRIYRWKDQKRDQNNNNHHHHRNSTKYSTYNTIFLSGIITAYLWECNVITFLATPYWGYGLWILLGFLSILSLKVCCTKHSNNITTTISSSSSSNNDSLIRSNSNVTHHSLVELGRNNTSRRRNITQAINDNMALIMEDTEYENHRRGGGGGSFLVREASSNNLSISWNNIWMFRYTFPQYIYSILLALLSWVDYVSWNEDGQMIQVS